MQPKRSAVFVVVLAAMLLAGCLPAPNWHLDLTGGYRLRYRSGENTLLTRVEEGEAATGECTQIDRPIVRFYHSGSFFAAETLLQEPKDKKGPALRRWYLVDMDKDVLYGPLSQEWELLRQWQVHTQEDFGGWTETCRVPQGAVRDWFGGFFAKE